MAVCAIASLGLSCPYATEDRERNPAGRQGHDLVSLFLPPLFCFHNLVLSFCVLPLSIHECMTHYSTVGSDLFQGKKLLFSKLNIIPDQHIKSAFQEHVELRNGPVQTNHKRQ